MRVFVATMMVAFSLCVWGCGSTDSGGNPVDADADANTDPNATRRRQRRRPVS